MYSLARIDKVSSMVGLYHWVKMLDPHFHPVEIDLNAQIVPLPAVTDTF